MPVMAFFTANGDGFTSLRGDFNRRGNPTRRCAAILQTQDRQARPNPRSGSSLVRLSQTNEQKNTLFQECFLSIGGADGHEDEKCP